MIGRLAYDNPFLLAQLDRFYEDCGVNDISRREIIEEMIKYLDSFEGEEGRVLPHLLGLFHGVRGSSQWKRLLSPPWNEKGSQVLTKSLSQLPEESLDVRSI